MSLVYLDELCDSISETYDKNTENIVLINTSNVFNGKVLNHEFVPNKDIKGQFKKLFQKGDILYSEIRPANKHYAFVDFESKDYVASTKLMVLRPKKEKIRSKYLYYILKNKDVVNFLQGLAESRSGTFPQITFSELSTIDIDLPSLENQDIIVEIIDNIESKIENLEKINKNLEQLLHTIFNYWFVSFGKFENSNFTKTFLGDIPEGWNCGVLRDLLTLIKNPIKANETNGLPYLPIDIIPMNSLGISELKSDDEANSSLITFDKNDILIGAMRVYFHRVVISPCSGVTRSTCFVLKPKKEEYLSYLLLLCNLDQTIQYAQNTSKGTTMPYAVWNNGLGDMDIIIPPENVLKDFHELVFPIIEKIRDSYNEINKLQQLRDTLLPKLMSGEIDVSKINCDLKYGANNLILKLKNKLIEVTI